MKPSDIDRIIVGIAAQSLSIVHSRDLRIAGVSDEAVARRVRNRFMAPVVGRTFAVGPQCEAPTFDMKCMAAVLAAGTDALLDGETGATMLDLWNRRCNVVHVSSPEHAVRSVAPPFRFTRQRGMWLPDEGRMVGPIAVAGVRQIAGTFARDHTPWQLAYVIFRALYLELTTLDALQGYADARSRAPGNATLRAAIDLVRARSAGTRCLTEDSELADLLRAGAPVPIVNTRGVMGLYRDEPDFVWTDRMLNIESDGGHHTDPAQAEDDERRDQDTDERGWGVLRVRSRDYWRRRRRVVELMMRFLAGRPVPRIPGTRILQV